MSKRLATEQDKKAVTTEEKFVMEGNEKAHVLAKDEEEVDGGAMAKAKSLNYQITEENLCLKRICGAFSRPGMERQG